MDNKEEQPVSPEEEPLQFWFLRPWMPLGIAGIAGFMTIVFGFREDWKLAIAVVIVGCTFSTTSWVLRFYYRQLNQRDRQRQNQFQKALQSLKSEYAGKIEAREAANKAREETIKQLKGGIVTLGKKITLFNESERRIAEALLRFIQDCRQENEKMLSEYNLIKEEPNNIKEFIQKGLASNFLQTALERIIQIFQVLLPTTSLWAAVRQYIPGEGIFITAKRAGNYNPKRKEFTQPIKKDRSISKMIREQFKKDGVGIIITHPGEPLYDEADGDKFQENLSIMAGPIVRHRESNKGQIITEMPMWIALNSPEEKAFQEGLKSYMSICLETISELLGTWPKIIKGTK